MYYEKSNMIHALVHALEAYKMCEGNLHPETIFSANTLLAYILYGLGADSEADGIMNKMDDYISTKAQFLHVNHKAIHFAKMIKSGNKDAAKEWIDLYASRAKHLTFYQICKHYATLRAYIALEYWALAIDIGKRLQHMAVEYNRPLDQIESLILTSIALWNNENKAEAALTFAGAIDIAEVYGFTQHFVNDGIEVLPMLWESVSTEFTENLIKLICKKYKITANTEAPVILTPRQKLVLSYLGEGLSYKEIAVAMGLGINTVKSHIKLLYKRLGVSSASEAILKAKAVELF